MIADLRKVLPLRLQVVSLFLFVMWLFFQAYQPWEPIGDDLLLESGRFNNATDLFGWSRELGQVTWSDETGYVELQTAARLRYNLPIFTGDLLLATGRIRSHELTAGNSDYQKGRMLLYFEDAGGNILWSHPHTIGDVAGTHDWLTFTTLIEVPEQARKGWVELAHHGKSGVVYFDDVSVRPAIWKKAYQHWQMTFGMLWASIMMWLVLNTPFWRNRWGQWLLACGLLIIVGVTLPHETVFQVASSGVNLTKKVLHDAPGVMGETQPDDAPSASAASPGTASDGVSSAEQSATSRQAITVQPAAPKKSSLLKSLTPNDFQKFGHYLLFMVIGFVSFMGFYGQLKTSLLLFSQALFALSTEVLQLAVDGRHFLLSDFLIDLTGICFGLAIAAGYRLLRPAQSGKQS